MKISVVTIVYNRARFISGALESTARQTYPNVEHILQDGGSTDGTLDIIQQHDMAEIKLVSEPDAGIYDALNKGIKRATGDIIGVMHSDDFFADETVLERVAATMSDTDCDGVYGDLNYVSASDTGKTIRKWRSGNFEKAKLRKGWMPPHPTLYLRREVFDKFGLYDPSYRISADYDAMLRFLVKGNISLAYIPEVLVKMRVGGESNKSLAKILQKSREDYRAIRSYSVGGVGTLALKNLSKVAQFI